MCSCGSGFGLHFILLFCCDVATEILEWFLRTAFAMQVGCVAGTFIFVAVVAIRTLWSFLSYFEEPPVNGTAPDDKGRYRPSFSQPE